MDEPYSNREIREFFADIKKDLSDIKSQVTRTNGRVSSLENWRWFIMGGLAIISIFLVPVILSYLK